MPPIPQHEFARLAAEALAVSQDTAKVIHGQPAPPQAFAMLSQRLLPFLTPHCPDDVARDIPTQAILAATRRLQGAADATPAELSAFLKAQHKVLWRMLKADGTAPSVAECRALHGFSAQLARAAGQLAHPRPQ